MDSLTISLFEPGMSILHRAGLGGLACTLDVLKSRDYGGDRWLERAEVTKDSIYLAWEGGAEGAAAFFERLYGYAFALDDGIINLPGCYESAVLDPQVKAELQRGMSMTILQFAPNRKSNSKTPVVKKYDTGENTITIEHQFLVSYTHQSAWRDMVAARGTLLPLVSIKGTIAPGFMERHAAHPSTTIDQRPGLAIALHFALVGTLSLPIGRSGGVLIIPDVDDLQVFTECRPLLNPRKARECQVSSPADAALQAQLRLKGRGDRGSQSHRHPALQAEASLKATSASLTAEVGRCLAVMFASSTWNSKQKSRSKVLDVEPESSELDLFSKVMSIEALLPRIIEAKPEKKGDPPRKFWAGGIVRAFVADNLARHRLWFEDFRRLVVGSDGATSDDQVRLLDYEREGLIAMIDQEWSDAAHEILVRSLHQAMRQRFGIIWDDVKKDQVTFLNRFKRQMDRWRLALAHAKTADDARKALMDIWSGVGQVQALAESWEKILPILRDEDRWQLSRDLGLLALASYKSSRPEEGDDESGTESNAV